MPRLSRAPVSKRDIEALWDAFNDVAEGFGLSPDEFRTICVRADLAASLRLTQEQLEQRALAIFCAFDTDSVRPAAARGPPPAPAQRRG